MTGQHWRLSGLLSVALLLTASALAMAEAGEPGAARGRASVLLALPEARIQEPGLTRVEWNYTFLRDNRLDHVYNTDQTLTGTRSNHRKTHLVTWRFQHGLTERIQPEAEIVYRAYRQHTHSDGDEHDRNDDGDFERLFAGASYQALQESGHAPALRLRGGLLIPRRAETEGIGQETGFDLMASSSKRVGDCELSGAAGYGLTFDNRDHPADPVFTGTPISKGHDLRTFSYGLGLIRRLDTRWRANLELAGKAFDEIVLNRRAHKSAVSLVPGLVYTSSGSRQDVWLGFGVPIGLSRDADHFGVAIRTGARF